MVRRDDIGLLIGQVPTDAAAVKNPLSYGKNYTRERERETSSELSARAPGTAAAAAAAGTFMTRVYAADPRDISVRHLLTGAQETGVAVNFV